MNEELKAENPMASLGGKASAAKLTATERRERAKRAAEARWNAGVAQAVCGSPDRPLVISGIEIQAYVLEDGTRVLTQGDIQEALGRHRKANVRNEDGEEQVPPILQGKGIKPFISNELLEKSRPIKFRTPQGTLASGYCAEILPEICEVFLKARDGNALQKQQAHIAVRADILVRGLAAVGIIALVDEATGYQDMRAKNALATYLERFVAKEIQNYVKLFPIGYYKGLCRLRGVPFSADLQLPRYFGRLTNNIVYARLAPAVLEELRRKNPVINGRRKNKHYNWLTPGLGHPKLLQHLGSVVTLMELAEDSWDAFVKMLDKIHPVHQPMPLFEWAEAHNRTAEAEAEVEAGVEAGR
jgi:hypothetical protein